MSSLVCYLCYGIPDKCIQMTRSRPHGRLLFMFLDQICNLHPRQFGYISYQCMPVVSSGCCKSCTRPWHPHSQGCHPRLPHRCFLVNTCLGCCARNSKTSNSKRENLTSIPLISTFRCLEKIFIPQKHKAD